MTEPDVALTDYLLAIECLVFFVGIFRVRTPHRFLQRSAVLFFATIGIASLAGGTVHGFFLDETTTGYHALWRLTMLSLGGTALACFLAGVALAFLESRKILENAALFCFGVYAVYALTGTRPFVTAIAAYVPTILFLLVSFAIYQRRTGEKAARLGIASVAITLLASIAQQLKWGLHPTYFNHNAVYHVLEAGALGLMFVSFRRLLAPVLR